MYSNIPDFSPGFGFKIVRHSSHGNIPDDGSIVYSARYMAVEERCGLIFRDRIRDKDRFNPV